MNKILMVGSSASMLKNFNMRNIKILLSLGCEVDVAANFENPGSITVDSADRFRKELEGIGVNVIDVPFERRMGTLKGNFEACIILMQLLRHKEYTFVHVHSALAGVLTRFVAAINHVPVIYTVHGFQFMKGGSLKRWLAFFPVEWVLSIFTKVIISINDEDNLLLKNFFPVSVKKINGVGIDVSKFKITSRKKAKLLSDLKIHNQETVFITVAELTDRKNQKMAIEAFSKIKKSNWKYLLIGLGSEYESLRRLVQDLGLQNHVIFLGYQENVVPYYEIADFSLYPSKLEGLLTAGMESLASGTPIIGSSVRGVRDLIIDGENGILIPDLTDKSLIESINKALSLSSEDKSRMKVNSFNSAEQYDKSIVDDKMTDLYAGILERKNI